MMPAVANLPSETLYYPAFITPLEVVRRGGSLKLHIYQGKTLLKLRLVNARSEPKQEFSGPRGPHLPQFLWKRDKHDLYS